MSIGHGENPVLLGASLLTLFKLLNNIYEHGCILLKCENKLLLLDSADSSNSSIINTSNEADKFSF